MEPTSAKRRTPAGGTTNVVQNMQTFTPRPQTSTGPSRYFVRLPLINPKNSIRHRPDPGDQEVAQPDRLDLGRRPHQHRRSVACRGQRPRPVSQRRRSRRRGEEEFADRAAEDHRNQGFGGGGHEHVAQPVDGDNDIFVAQFTSAGSATCRSTPSTPAPARSRARPAWKADRRARRAHRRRHAPRTVYLLQEGDRQHRH